MADESRDQTGGATPSKRAVRGFAVVAVIAAIAIAVLVGWALWMRGRAPRPAPRASIEAFEPAWASAMAKAGVEATFPALPLDIENLRFSGRHSFEATFTAEEITALLNVYRFSTNIAGSSVSLGASRLSFGPRDEVGIEGTLIADGSPYFAKATASVRYEGGTLVSPGLRQLEVEGFGVRGSKKRDAGQALLEYFNLFIDSVPGLTIRSAQRVGEDVRVEGFAPDSIEPVPR